MVTRSPEDCQRTRVLIVDDHPIVREGLKAQIAKEKDLELCGEAEDMPGALRLLKSAQPDVMIIDITLKSGSGIELIKQIRSRNDVVKIVVWSMYTEDLYAERALRAGAQGYVCKGEEIRGIFDAIRSVRQGRVYLSGDQADLLLQRLVGGGKESEATPVETLSDRELEAFEMIGRGCTTEKIAEKMKVSPKTVETYRARIKEKLNLANHTELIHAATRWALEKR